MTTDSIIGALGIIGISLLAFSSLNAQDSVVAQEQSSTSQYFATEERIELDGLQLPSLDFSIETGDVLGVLSQSNLGIDSEVDLEAESTLADELPRETETLPEETEETEEVQSERRGLMSFFRNIFSRDNNNEEQPEELVENGLVAGESEADAGSITISANDTIWDLLRTHGLDSAQTAIIVQNLYAASESALAEVGLVSENPDLIYPGDILQLEKIITLYS